MQSIGAMSFVVGLLLAAQVQAQTASFQFTGTLEFVSGPDSAQFGSSVSGTLTIDYGATTDYYYRYDGPGDVIGEYRDFYNQGFAIEGSTDGGFIVDSSSVDTTILQAWAEDVSSDANDASWQQNGVWAALDDGSTYRALEVSSYSNNVGSSDGIADFTEWSPLREDYARVFAYAYDHATGEWSRAVYTIVFYGPLVTNIVIDGSDTGIADFDYNGSTVGNLIADLASSARNHGQFVNQVAKLCGELKKAGLISGEESEILKSAAAESSIGK